MDEAEEVDGAAVVASGEASKVLELVEAAFDACGIGRRSDRAGSVLIWSGWRDDCLGLDVGDKAAQGIGIIGSVGKNDLIRRHKVLRDALLQTTDVHAASAGDSE